MKSILFALWISLATVLGANFDTGPAVSQSIANYTALAQDIQRRAILDQFRMGWDFGVFREDFNGVSTNDAYWPCIAIGTNRYACWEIRRLQNSSYWGPHELNSAQVRTCTVIYDESFTNFVFSGTWTQVTGQSATWGTTYKRSNTSNDTCTIYVPTGSTLIGIRGFIASNGGVGKVSIDGDLTKANLLSSANDLVTAGTLASSVLVANGGNLNPTDRVINFYLSGSSQDQLFPLADNLTAGTHTVVVTVTGDKQSASTDTRVVITAMNFGGPSYTLASSGAKLEVFRPNSDNVNSNATSVYEYALQLAPAGATTGTNSFIGNWHGSDIETAFTLTNAGAAVTLTNFQVYAGSSNLFLTRTSSLRHPGINSGNTEIAACSVKWTPIAGAGLKVDTSISHETSGNAFTSYSGMMPVTPPLTSGTTFYAPKDYLLTNSDGSENGNSQSDIAVMWDPSSVSGAMVYFPSVANTVGNWAFTGTNGLWLEDRSGGAIKKVYLQRIGNGIAEPYANGEIWSASAVYKIQQWQSGAAANVSRQYAFPGH